MNSRAKGKRIELKAAHFLTSHGIPAQRGARNGVKDGQDLILPPEYDIHIEVKGDKSVRPGTKAMEDALDQADEGAKQADKFHRCVLWHEDRKGWRLTARDDNNLQQSFYREADIVRMIEWTKPEPASS
jgi:hypothetical protein